MAQSRDSFKTAQTLSVGKRSYGYYRLKTLSDQGIGDVSRLPYSLKILLENLLRNENGRDVSEDDIRELAGWAKKRTSDREIAFYPSRVLMQDFTGVPAIVDLAAMRDAMRDLGGDPDRINPIIPTDLVIDHSVTVESYANPDAFRENVEFEFERNGERYTFLKWGQQAFDDFRVVPPGTGICHQVNLEYLGRVVWSRNGNGTETAFPDTLVGTDSHTTMINGLGILGWGVGGIEAEAAMLGQPITMVIPDVIGVKLSGRLRSGVTATDLVLRVTEILRKKGVVGKFVEYYGPGIAHLPIADRATIANMSPEYGATCGIFPVDRETITYLRFTGRDDQSLQLVEQYAKAQGLFHDENTPEPVYSDVIELDMSTVEPSIAGPRRPQDRVSLTSAAESFRRDLQAVFQAKEPEKQILVEGADFSLDHGHVVIAAITSCTNTSNPSVMIAAGLLARKARERGITSRPWVKTSLAPGSQVVTDYLLASDLQKDLDALGFALVGYGCTTCIGNSGPLPDRIAKVVEQEDLTVCAVLSGNRNFEGRINPHAKASYLASPPLVVAYALAGSLKVDITKEPLGTGADGRPVYLKEIWPSDEEIRTVLEKSITPKMFASRYDDVFKGTDTWRRIAVGGGEVFAWEETSTYIKLPPYFVGMTKQPQAPEDITGARLLALFGDSITTDHISPAGSIPADGPAGKYLIGHGVERKDFNSFGSRRGNHEVMMRGTFANIRIRNELAGDTVGGYTRYAGSDTVEPIYDVSMRYQKEETPLIVIAGKEYGTGSSRDWAAKGALLLGVRAVVAESYERIHRSNLIGMGVMPLQFREGADRHALGLTGNERFDVTGISGGISPRMEITLTIHRPDGTKDRVPLLCRIDTETEADYYRHGGILQYVLRSMAGNGRK